MSYVNTLTGLRLFLQWGNTFLQRSQLRSLRNLSALSFDDETRILRALIPPNIHDEDICILYRWGELCRGQPVQRYLSSVGRRYLQTKEYLNANATEKEDPFAGCYFYDGTVSEKGIRLRIEAGIR